jgi:hypothetical protein
VTVSVKNYFFLPIRVLGGHHHCKTGWGKWISRVATKEKVAKVVIHSTLTTRL